MSDYSELLERLADVAPDRDHAAALDRLVTALVHGDRSPGADPDAGLTVFGVGGEDR